MSPTQQLLLNRQADNRYEFLKESQGSRTENSIENGQFLGLFGGNAILQLANGDTITAKLNTNSYVKPGQDMQIKYSGGRAWVNGMPQG